MTSALGSSPSVVSSIAPANDARRGAIILILLAAAALMVNYVETMLVPALPTLVAFFDAGSLTPRSRGWSRPTSS